MWDRLLKNARVVDPVNGRDGVMDVAVKDGLIAAVGPNLKGEVSEVEDLTKSSKRPRPAAQASTSRCSRASHP